MANAAIISLGIVPGSAGVSEKKKKNANATEEEKKEEEVPG